MQFEVELPAKTLAKCQSPRAIDAAAIGRVNNELHATRVVKKAFENDSLLSGQAAQGTMRRAIRNSKDNSDSVASDIRLVRGAET